MQGQRGLIRSRAAKAIEPISKKTALGVRRSCDLQPLDNFQPCALSIDTGEATEQ